MENHDWEWLRKQDVNLENGAGADSILLKKLQNLTDSNSTVNAPHDKETVLERKTVSRSQRKERLQQTSQEQPLLASPEPLVIHTTVPPTKTPSTETVKGSMPKKKKDEYQEWLKQDFSNLFNTLGLKERQVHYLKSRWLDQVLWMEGRASRSRDWHYRLRLTTIIGGVIIPALVSLNFIGNENQQLKQGLAVSTFFLSQLVAVSAASEQFFNHGDRWKHYRRSVETLKTQGWQFFEMSGPYQPYKSNDEAFHAFAAQVEDILQKDVEVYATQVTQAKKEDEQKEGASRSGDPSSERSRGSVEMAPRA